mmetsp:Transcript_15369/g.31838  ORF Transcript_15369/g.31838 Transcript_15369/m.31838 type:complete len:368 (-) Transcript_15369:831-1934(-)
MGSPGRPGSGGRSFRNRVPGGRRQSRSGLQGQAKGNRQGSGHQGPATKNHQPDCPGHALVARGSPDLPTNLQPQHGRGGYRRCLGRRVCRRAGLPAGGQQRAVFHGQNPKHLAQRRGPGAPGGGGIHVRQGTGHGMDRRRTPRSIEPGGRDRLVFDLYEHLPDDALGTRGLALRSPPRKSSSNAGGKTVHSRLGNGNQHPSPAATDAHRAHGPPYQQRLRRGSQGLVLAWIRSGRQGRRHRRQRRRGRPGRHLWTMDGRWWNGVDQCQRGLEPDARPGRNPGKSLPNPTLLCLHCQVLFRPGGHRVVQRRKVQHHRGMSPVCQQPVVDRSRHDGQRPQHVYFRTRKAQPRNPLDRSRSHRAIGEWLQ